MLKCPECHLSLYALWEFSLHLLWIPLSPLGCVGQDGKKSLIAEKWTRKWSGWFPLKKGFVVIGWRADVELDDVAEGLVLCRWKYIRGSEFDSFPILLLLSFCVQLQLLVITMSLLSARHASFLCLFPCSLKIDKLFHSVYCQKVIVKGEDATKIIYFSHFEHAICVVCNREVEEQSRRTEQ